MSLVVVSLEVDDELLDRIDSLAHVLVLGRSEMAETLLARGLDAVEAEHVFAGLAQAEPT